MRLGLILLALLLAGPAAAAETHPVTDLAGRVVAVPVRVERVVCLEVLCAQKMLMLGGGDRIIELYRNGAPWLSTVFPAIDRVATTFGDPNFEDLLARRADVVFFAYDAERTRPKLDALGLVALTSQPVGRRAATAEEYLEDTKASVRMFAQVLGGEAIGRAEEWCGYLDERVHRVTERVARIPEAERLKLYYVRGPRALDTQGLGANSVWFGRLAGARMVAAEAPLAAKGAVAIEDILRWNPDMVLVGRQYPLDLVLGDPRWADIAAVKTGRVVASPEGVFYWDGGPEGVLLMEFIAKRLYPTLFADLDLAAEVKDYYARFYRTRLDDAQVDKLLRGLSPDGGRASPWNN